jgi:DHA1 family multidrug resistance protein-like MFS transporter
MPDRLPDAPVPAPQAQASEHRAAGGGHDWRRAFVALCASQAIAMLAFGMATPFLPLYVQQLGIRDPQTAARWAGAMAAGGALVMAAMAPVWGTVADRYGRKPMVTRALIGGGTIVALMSVVRSPEQLLVLRVIQGAFSGTVAASRTLVASIAPAAELGFALGVMQTAGFVGNSAGPLIGGLVADRFGFRASFLLTAALLIAGGLAVLRLVSEDFKRPARAAKGGGGIRGALGVFAEVPGVAALIGMLFFVQTGSSAISPVLPLFVASLLPEGHGSVASLTGLVIGSAAITSAVAAGLGGKLGDRIGHERVMAVCALCSGLLYLPQALVTSPWQLLALRAGIGAFTGGMMPGVMATIALRSPAARRGWVFGLTATATSLGNAAGPALGALAAGAFGLRASFLLTGALMTGAGLWVALAVGRGARSAHGPAQAPTGRSGQTDLQAAG